MARAIFDLSTTDSLPPFTGATQWINTKPLTPEGLRGKVVLVNFWTYTCVNWLRTLPYVRAWAQKYKDQGLVVVGVHTPEFGLEHNIDNVQQAIDDLQVTYPVGVDNKYAIWTAFSNHYWPALYFADTQGHIRYHQFGEGEYEMSERVIQQLLIEAGVEDIDENLVAVDLQGVTVPADWDSLESPETYLGYLRATNFVSPGGIVAGRLHEYDGDVPLRLNQWALAGSWTVGEEAAVLDAAGGKIVFRFHARDLNLVMGPVMQGAAVPFRVRVDDEPPGIVHGFDVDAEGYGIATEQRLYQLVRQRGPITDCLFEIEFLEPSVQALVFTFG